MSQLVPSVVNCPRCATTWSAALFRSVDADTIDPQVDAILDDSFERAACSECGHSFRPEHTLLFASHVRRLWIVMQPPADRREFAKLERGVERVVADNIAQAAPAAAQRLRGIRPRLVFGQHMLTEAVRISYTSLDPSLLECAKLLTVRRNLPALIGYGPFELCFERFQADLPLCAIRTLPGNERVGELTLPAEALAEARAGQAVLQERFPELFERPYVSATRYLIGDTV